MRLLAATMVLGLLLPSGCDRAAGGAGAVPKLIVTRLVDSDDMVVLDIEVQSSDSYRLVVQDVNGKTRDAALVQTQPGHVTITAGLTRTDDPNGDVLTWVVALSSPDVSVAGPSQVPVSEGATLDSLFQVLFAGDSLRANEPTDLVKVQSRTLQLVLQR